MACIDEVQKEGFLVKKGHVRHNWRTRWFVLLKQELLYFRTKQDRVPAGVVPLNGANLICPTLEASKKPWLLTLTTQDNRQYMIQAPDQSTREEWKLAIEDCIRRVNPAKSNGEMSPTRTFTRANSFAATNDTFRDIVQAMQDPQAGLKLQEFKLKASTPQNVKYFFAGKDAVDWLISWSFAEDRSSAITLASRMLQYGFFNPVHMDAKENMYKKVRDSLMAKEMVDAQNAYYDFVVFAPRESMHLFASGVEEGEESGSDSDSEDDILQATKRTISGTSIGMEDSKVLKQGFLLKKSKRRNVWKARKFVLRENEQNLMYYKVQSGAGGIPLKDLTVIEKDGIDTCPLMKSNSASNISSCLVSTTNTLPYRHNPASSHVGNRIVLLTVTGARYELEALNSEERGSWADYIRVASELC